MPTGCAGRLLCLVDLDRDLVFTLIERGKTPAHQHGNLVEFGGAGAQHGLGFILRQPFVGCGVIVDDLCAVEPLIVVGGKKGPIAGYATAAIASRDRRGGADGLGDAPSTEVFACARRQVLAFWDALDAVMPLYDGAGDAIDRQIDCQANPDRPTPNYDNISLQDFGTDPSESRDYR